ncbi:MAG: SDR family oxidoreductase [Spirochaetaceae bacterium]|nr:MAG: SDR family oxidoreductase [Spirochaetaceae bacterium]
MFDVTGKVYVITGGGGALCGEMAQALAERGARIALVDLSQEAAEERAASIRAAGGTVAVYACSVLDQDELTATARSIEREWGVPDALINGAGGNHPSGSTTASFVTPGFADASSETTFYDLSVEGFERVFDLNFLGTVLPTRVFTKAMAARGSGTVVNMSSMSAITPLTKVGAYSAAKAAVANFTSWLAVHLAPVGVRVNALAPGFFMTEQLRFLHIDRETGDYTPRAKAVLAHTPMARYGEPAELVGAVIWLTTDASSFVTGILLPIDGGYSSFTI